MDESGKYPNKIISHTFRVRVIMIGYEYIIFSINPNSNIILGTAGSIFFLNLYNETVQVEYTGRCFLTVMYFGDWWFIYYVYTNGCCGDGNKFRVVGYIQSR